MRLKDCYKKIRSWMYHHFKKRFFKLLKATLSSYPWDFAYLYLLEKAKIQEMIEYHEANRLYAGVEHDIRDMKICVNLIDAYLDCDSFMTIRTKVNLGNVKRFAKNDEEAAFMLRFPDELYKAKAKYLYHKIRLERDGRWWD